MPGTDPSRARSEFFKGTLQQALRALKGVGVGDLYTFAGNNISQITKQTLKRGDAIETQQVPLRKSERLDKPSFLPGGYSINKETDPQNAAATFLPATYSIDKATADALTQNDAPTARALERLGQVRRSPRLAGDPHPNERRPLLLPCQEEEQRPHRRSVEWQLLAGRKEAGQIADQSSWWLRL